MPAINPYSITSFIESNTIANRGIMEIGGYAAPNVIMANNKVEARERAEKAAMFFGFSLILPVACVPVLNRIFLKIYNITDKLNGKGIEIIQLSKKYLTKDDNYMIEGIKLLKEEFKNKKNYGNIKEGIEYILNKFPNKGELKKLLIKSNNRILISDFLITGACLSSIYWISNYITKIKTGRNGFSAEFEMADKKIIEDKAKKYKEQHKKKLFISVGILLTAGLGILIGLDRGMLSKNLNSKFSNFIKKHANKLDYKNGLYMSRMVLLLITILGIFQVPCYQVEIETSLNITLLRILFLTVYFSVEI